MILPFSSSKIEPKISSFYHHGGLLSGRFSSLGYHSTISRVRLSLNLVTFPVQRNFFFHHSEITPFIPFRDWITSIRVLTQRYSQHGSFHSRLAPETEKRNYFLPITKTKKFSLKGLYLLFLFSNSFLQNYCINLESSEVLKIQIDQCCRKYPTNEVHLRAEKKSVWIVISHFYLPPLLQTQWMFLAANTQNCLGKNLSLNIIWTLWIGVLYKICGQLEEKLNFKIYLFINTFNN